VRKPPSPATLVLDGIDLEPTALSAVEFDVLVGAELMICGFFLKLKACCV
jgi:hypothetical protein